MSSEAVCVCKPPGMWQVTGPTERFRGPCYHEREPKTKNLVWSTHLPSVTPGGVQKGGGDEQAPSRQAKAPELPWAPPPQRDRMETLGKRDRGTVPGRGVVGPPANAPSHIYPGGSSFSIDHAVVSRASQGCPPQHTVQGTEHCSENESLWEQFKAPRQTEVHLGSSPSPTLWYRALAPT